MEHDEWGGDPPLPISETPKNGGCGWLIVAVLVTVIICGCLIDN